MTENIPRGGRLRVSILTLLFAGAMAGCESDATSPVEDFDEEAVAADVDAVLGAVDEDIARTLVLASQGLAQAGGSGALMPALASPATTSGGFADIGALSTARAAFAAKGLLPAFSTSSGSFAEPIFPSNLLGVTFVWNGTSYVPDDALTGAPENGVRFLVYAINPVTRLPVEPLVEVGFLDLTDDSSPSSTRLGILLVDTTGAEDVDLVDYFIDISFTSTETATTIVLAALGFVSDGVETLEFDLDQTFSFEEAGGGSLGVDYDFSAQNLGVTLSFDAFATFDPETEDASGLTAALTVSDGTDVVVLGVTESATGVLDGEVTFNGATAILVGGTAASPQFSRPDGSELTAVEIQALVSIVDAITEVLLIAEQLFAPIGGVVPA
jgi:hypothetical protein